MRTWAYNEYTAIFFKIGKRTFKMPKHLSIMFCKDECAWLNIFFGRRIRALFLWMISKAIVWSQVFQCIRVACINYVILPCENEYVSYNNVDGQVG